MNQIIKIKRTTTPNHPPAAGSLSVGELCAGLADKPARMWIGVPTSIDASGILELFAGGAVYVSDTAPVNVPDNSLWWDSAGGRLYLLFNDGDSVQWVDASPPDVGPPGPQGDAATITIGDVMTGNPGSAAVVTNVGTEHEAELEFSIPRGDQGPPGEIIPAVPECGLLQTGAPNAGANNTLRFIPFKGNWVRINGVMHEIPASGVTQTGLTGFVNGAPGTMAINTVYLVYLFDNAGTLTFDFWARSNAGSAHSMSTTPGNLGTEIRTGDDTRTLVGIIWTNNATNAFYDDARYRYTRSWFNRQRTILNSGYLAIAGGTADGWFVRGASVDFVQFANEPLFLTMGTNMQLSATATVYARLAEGGSGFGFVSTITAAAGNWCTHFSSHGDMATADQGRTWNCMTYHPSTTTITGNTQLIGTLG